MNLDGVSIGGTVSLDEHNVDRSHVARALLRLALTRIMRDGVFHADPHPGNVLVLDDGRIGLLDFGSVGRLDPTARSARRELFVAFDREDPAAARDALLAILVSAADVDEQRLERAFGHFIAHHLGPSTTNDTALLTERGLVPPRS